MIGFLPSLMDTMLAIATLAIKTPRNIFVKFLQLCLCWIISRRWLFSSRCHGVWGFSLFACVNSPICLCMVACSSQMDLFISASKVKKEENSRARDLDLLSSRTNTYAIHAIANPPQKHLDLPHFVRPLPPLLLSALFVRSRARICCRISCAACRDYVTTVTL